MHIPGILLLYPWNIQMGNSSKANTILEEETVLEGNLKFSSSLNIKGRFNGSIETTGLLFVDKNAVVKAMVNIA